MLCIYVGLQQGGEISETGLRVLNTLATTLDWPMKIERKPYTVLVWVDEDWLPKLGDALREVVHGGRPYSWTEGHRVHAVLTRNAKRFSNG